MSPHYAPATPSPVHILAEGGRRLEALGMAPMGALYIPDRQWHHAGTGVAPCAEVRYIVPFACHDYAVISVWFRAQWRGADAKTAIEISSATVEPCGSRWEMTAGDAYDFLADLGYQFAVYRCAHTFAPDAPGSWHPCSAATLQADIQDAAHGGCE
jgi:hypothetical protein